MATQMNLIDNWRDPDIPEMILTDALNIIKNNSEEAFSELFALIYFNDTVPQNKVIKFRKHDKQLGSIMAVSGGSWVLNYAAKFYDSLDKVMHKSIERIKMMAVERQMEITGLDEALDFQNKRGKWDKQIEYVTVITERCYHTLPDNNLLDKHKAKLISDWDDLTNMEATIDSLCSILQPDFEKMTAMIDGDTTKGRILDFQTKVLYPKVVELLYFNPKTPEHRVIKLRHIAAGNGALLVMVNGAWQEKNQREFLPNLFALVTTVLTQVHTIITTDAEGIKEAKVKLEGAYNVSYYVLADDDLVEYKKSELALKDKVIRVIMAGETKPKKSKPVKMNPPPLRLTRSTAAKNITEIRQEIAALPKDGKEMAAMRGTQA